MEGSSRLCGVWCVFVIVVAIVVALTMTIATYALASEDRPFAANQPAYRRLLLALSRYRAIEANGGWPMLGADLNLKPGVDDDRVVVLRQRLLAEGDLLTKAEGRTFDEMLATAVKRFQSRHGLTIDGRVGRKTLSELNVTAHDRIAQIAVNLERWREVPAELPPRRLEINIPAAELVVFDEDRPLMTMQVVVGTSQTPTPVLQSRVSAVVFNPTWTVPMSILRNEILPWLHICGTNRWKTLGFRPILAWCVPVQGGLGTKVEFESVLAQVLMDRCWYVTCVHHKHESGGRAADRLYSGT
jgi:murein L,D-transpeptidase YcbB/YkuD